MPPPRRRAKGAGAVTFLASLLHRLPEVFPDDDITPGMLESSGIAALVHPLRDDVVGDVGRVLWVLLGSVGFILLIACANVANLFLVRAEGRQREVAIRCALGAERRDIASALLVESAVLGLASGACGLVLAAAGVRLLLSIGPETVPRLEEIGIDGGVLAFTVAISLLRPREDEATNDVLPSTVWSSVDGVAVPLPIRPTVRQIKNGQGLTPSPVCDYRSPWSTRRFAP